MVEMWVNTKPVLLILESKLKCSICEQLPVNPQLLWCKHSFCKECILRMRSCPKCSFTVVPQEIVPDIMTNKLLHLMKVASEITKCKEIQESEVKKWTATEKSRKSTCNPEENSIKTSPKLVKHFVKPSSEKMLVENISEKFSAEMKTPKRIVQKKSSHTSSCTPDNSLKEIKISTGRLNKTKKDHCKSASPNIKTPFKNSSVKTCVLFSAKKSQSTNKVNVKGETPLHIACRQGKLDLVQQLLTEGAEPNVKDYAFWTPLCDAVGHGNLEVVKVLLEAGAAVNTPANLNTTALVEAVVRNDKAMVQLLLKHGADMNQRTALNNTALSIADDEMKGLMLAVNITPHPPPPPPRVTTTPRAVLASKLPEHLMDSVMSLCKKFNLSLSTTFMEDVTHVVVETTAQNTCHGSVDVMLGILSGCSVVSVDWVTACLEAGSLLAVDNYQPCGTIDLPQTNVFHKARLNRESMLPRLFDGCHMSLQQEQVWPAPHKRDVVMMIQAAGARYQARPCDAERIPPTEQTVMFHTDSTSPLGMVSHIILYQPGPAEPLLKYNMQHVKSFSVSWFLKCVKTFSILQTPV
uniref:RING-type E3 ubiquitin transferase BRCA1 n=1 Tax=Graphocephala atropunctata TaxID=36148 RepID=A0A1B6MAB3_9HEMI